MHYNDYINELLILNLILLIFTFLFISKKYIIIFFFIFPFLLHNIKNDDDEYEYTNCQKPTKENPYMNYDNNVTKKKACSYYKSKNLIEKYTKFKIFDLFYNQKNNLNFFLNGFYTKPITTYFHNYLPLMKWSYNKSTKKNIINKLNITSYLNYNDNDNINILTNNYNTYDLEYIKYNNYINKLNDNFIK